MLYETKADLEREAAFMEKIGVAFKCCCHKLPMHWRVDMVMRRDKWCIGWGEIKVKNIKLKDIPDVYLNKDKYEYGVKLSKSFGGQRNCLLPLVLFLRCLDGDYRINLSTLKEHVPTKVFTAANHREDPKDTKEVLMIPSNLFREF
jgi:hypothetical protein